MQAADLAVLTGIEITPDRTALAPAGVQQQKSRPGPSAGLAYRKWFTTHQGFGAEASFANTNTRLANFAENNWIMNRVSVDGVYTYRWVDRRFAPFLKGGVGTMITIGGQAPSHALVGLDWRMEEVAGAGFTYRLSPQFGFIAEYNSRFFRNPDFSDHLWHPQRNVVSEPRIGITYTVGRRLE